MKKIIVCLLLTCLLTGCSLFFDLSNYVMPDDAEFLAVIERENTPEKFCSFMERNYKWKLHLLNYSPYQMWVANGKPKAGDCNDMSCAIVFAMNYHKYETYQIWVFYRRTLLSHALGVFVEENKYTYSSNDNYHDIYVNKFEDIVSHHCCETGRELTRYFVYDYDNKLIERGK